MANNPICNGTKIYIALEGGEEFIEIKNIVDIQLPDQSYNLVEAPLLNAESGISEQIKTNSRSGGDLTFNITVKDVNDAGLKAVMDAYNDESYVPVSQQPCFKIEPTVGEDAFVHGFVTGMVPGQYTKDALLSYAVTVKCNDVVTWKAKTV